jgi:uncharacterized membrane protein
MVRFVNLITDIFSFLCSQDPARSFEIAGRHLPCCQRCTGLYLGLAVSFIYLLLTRQYRKGLAPRSILYINIASLAIMPVFGFHLLDPGPVWRCWTGLIFGNAVAFLLLPAAFIIINEGRIFGRHTKASATSFWILFAFLNTMPLWSPLRTAWFFNLVLIMSLIALSVVAVCIFVLSVWLVRQAAAFFIIKGFSHVCTKS